MQVRRRRSLGKIQTESTTPRGSGGHRGSAQMPRSHLAVAELAHRGMLADPCRRVARSGTLPTLTQTAIYQPGWWQTASMLLPSGSRT
jgi:hypothetical protein